MASTRIHDSSAYFFPRVENEYLQAVIDWGFVGAAALALVMIWLATVAARNARMSLWEAGAFAGLLALAVENVTDFSLWMPGVALPAIAALACLTCVPVAVSSTPTRTWILARLGGIAAITIAILLCALPIGEQARSETAHVARENEKDPAVAAATARAIATWRRHPASYAAAGLVASTLFQARDRRAIAVANRGLVLHPTNGELHRLTAQMLLASQQRGQARTEYALAMKYQFRVGLLDEISAAFPADDDLIRALPLERAQTRELAERLAERGRVPAAQAYLARYLTYQPDDTSILLFAANLALNVGDVAKATDAARRAYALDPSSDAGVMLAQALNRGGGSGEAVTLLQSLLSSGRLPGPARMNVLVAMAETQVAAGQFDAAQQSLHEALALASGTHAAEIHRKLADVEDRRGNHHQAEWERHRAEELER
jgi:tetratricopeptide (TPR) repeat protein